MNCHVTTLTITREKIWQQIKNGINSIKIMEYLTAIIWICVRAMNCAPRRDHVPFCIVEAALDKGSMLWVFRHDATHPSSDWHNNLEDQPFIGNLCLSNHCRRLQYNFCECPDPWTRAGLTPMISSSAKICSDLCFGVTARRQLNATTQRPPATKPNLKSPKVAVKSQFGVTGV